MKYFSDNEQGMPPCTLTEINVDIWNVLSTSLYSPNVLRYYRGVFGIANLSWQLLLMVTSLLFPWR